MDGQRLVYQFVDVPKDVMIDCPMDAKATGGQQQAQALGPKFAHADHNERLQPNGSPSSSANPSQAQGSTGAFASEQAAGGQLTGAGEQLAGATGPPAAAQSQGPTFGANQTAGSLAHHHPIVQSCELNAANNQTGAYAAHLQHHHLHQLHHFA